VTIKYDPRWVKKEDRGQRGLTVRQEPEGRSQKAEEGVTIQRTEDSGLKAEGMGWKSGTMDWRAAG
jgi:hypothetical protein